MIGSLSLLLLLLCIAIEGIFCGSCIIITRALTDCIRTYSHKSYTSPRNTPRLIDEWLKGSQRLLVHGAHLTRWYFLPLECWCIFRPFSKRRRRRKKLLWTSNGQGRGRKVKGGPPTGGNRGEKTVVVVSLSLRRRVFFLSLFSFVLP